MGKGYRTGPVNKYGSGAKNKSRRQMFYKNERDVDDDLKDDSNEKARDVSYLEDESSSKKKPFIKKRGPQAAVTKSLNLEIKENAKAIEESEPVSDAYNQLVSKLGVSEKYKELFNKRKLEETGDMDDDLAAHYADESDEEDEDDDEDEQSEEEPDIIYQPKETSKNKKNATTKKQKTSENPPPKPVKKSADAELDEDTNPINEDEITEAALLGSGFEEEHETDEFVKRFNEMHTTEIENYEKSKPKLSVYSDELLGNTILSTKPLPKAKDLRETKVKQRLLNHIEHIKKQSKEELMTPFQSKVWSVINDYNDLFFAKRTNENAKELKEVYVLHIMNHLFKVRDKVLKNNAKRNAADPKDRYNLDLKDQGFNRPKALIIVPFRSSAVEIIELLLEQCPKTQQEQIFNKKRFLKEYGLEEDPGPSPRKPDDWNQTFKGNIDDCFRIGVSFTRHSVKIYSEFYSSDIIIASPLGLRLAIGNPGEKNQDFDFLSSMEIVILDQTDVFTMQNWEHLEFIFECLNQIPKDPRDTDFSRVRDWYLNGWAKYYRQTIILSPFITPDMNALWNKLCFNTKGSIKCKDNIEDGSITQVIPKIKQVFYKLKCDNITSLDDFRFEYFTTEILPLLTRSVQNRTLIFVPSYFDFVRLRNYFRKEEIEFCQISEYTDIPSVSRARSKFFSGAHPFMLFTERFHYFNRVKIRGVQNIVFYGLPQYAHFYSEMLNVIDAQDTSCMVLFSKFEKLQLERVVGTARCQRMLESEKPTFLFC